MPANQHEKTRKYPRVYAEIPAKAAFPFDEGSTVALITEQLGLGGCMLIGNHFFGMGRVFNLTLELNENEISVQAKILYEYTGERVILSGVKFLEIGLDEYMVLEEFMEGIT